MKKSTEPRRITDGLIRNLMDKLVADESDAARSSTPAAPSSVKKPVRAPSPRFLAPPPSAVEESSSDTSTSEDIYSEEKEDLSNITMRDLLLRIVEHYESPKTQQIARNAFTELQRRLEQDNNLFGAIEIHKSLSVWHDENGIINKQRVWLETLSPKVKLCVDLLAAARNIFQKSWHSKGTNKMGGSKTPDTINMCRLLLTDNNRKLFDGLKVSYYTSDIKYTDSKFTFKFETAETLMELLSQKVSLSHRKKYGELTPLLNHPNPREARDFDTCLELIEQHFPQIKYR